MLGSTVNDPLTIAVAWEIEQFIAPFEAVHPEPEICDIPANFPVPVEPETVMTVVLSDTNVPPVIATVDEIAVVPCAVSDAGVSVTVLAGHETTVTADVAVTP